MGGKKEPIDLVIAKGRKHLTQAETAERKASEPRMSADSGSKIRPPSWLPEPLRPEFNDLRRQLVALKIFDRVDRDTLARYVVASAQWQDATESVQAALKEKDVESTDEWSRLQERFFKQCRACANDMGLTVTSRCRLVLPEGTEKEENPFEAMMKERQNRA